jgi:hypothetical protein
MSGILESMKQEINTLQQDYAALKVAMATLAARPGGAVAEPAAVVDPFAGFGATPTTAVTPTPTNVTGEMITALIIKAVENPSVKEALGAEMKAMGINALPEAQPHQFAELYGRFQAVLTRMGGAATQPAALSIV